MCGNGGPNKLNKASSFVLKVLIIMVIVLVCVIIFIDNNQTYKLIIIFVFAPVIIVMIVFLISFYRPLKENELNNRDPVTVALRNRNEVNSQTNVPFQEHVAIISSNVSHLSAQTNRSHLYNRMQNPSAPLAPDSDNPPSYNEIMQEITDSASSTLPSFSDYQAEEKRNKQNTLAFLRAARNGNLNEVLEFHYNTGVNINDKGMNDITALHLASKQGHDQIVLVLLELGANVDESTYKGHTALHIACLAGWEKIVDLLVSHGANVNAQGVNGFTSLYMAAQVNQDKIVQYLLSHGADANMKTKDGFTPLDIAKQQGNHEVVSLLSNL